MALSQREIKFLTVLNETRLSDGKMSGRYFDEIKEQFIFSNEELNRAVIKLVEMGLLSEIAAGGNEYVYFHTEKVEKSELDNNLGKIQH